MAPRALSPAICCGTHRRQALGSIPLCNASILLACLAAAAACFAAPSLAATGASKSSKPWTGVNLALNLASKPISWTTAVSLVKKKGASAVKLFVPAKEAYDALASSDAAAQKWVDDWVVPYAAKCQITAIALSNEQLNPPFTINAATVVPAMWAVYRALKARNLHKQIKVVTPQHMGFLQNTYPPSNTEVLADFKAPMLDLLKFVNDTGSYLVLNCYPFFPFKDDSSISRDFAFFKGTNGFYDGPSYYQNLFEAMLDGALWAFDKLGYPNIDYVVGETGWPTDGHPEATVANAAQWVKALLGKIHSNQGTPKRPGKPIKAYLFEAFDEDQKDTSPGVFELHWGLATMDGKDKYPLSLNTKYPAPPTTKPALKLGPKGWCVMNQTASSKAVSDAVGWACGAGGVDCTKIVPLCTTTLFRASAVFNAYYQAKNRIAAACNFSGAAIVTKRNPYSWKQPKCPFPLATKATLPTFAPPSPAGSSGSQSWCVAQPGANATAVGAAVGWACGQAGMSCQSLASLCSSSIRASAVFNAYYQAQNRAAGSCNFSGVALVTSIDPSSTAEPNCPFPSSKAALPAVTPTPSTPSLTPQQQSWCVVKSGASASAIGAAIGWACGEGGVKCKAIVDACTPAHQASAIFNAYYQAQNQAAGSCNFGGVASLTSSDPSPKSEPTCQFPSSKGGLTATPSPPPPAAPSPPPPAAPTCSGQAAIGVQAALNWLCGADAASCALIQAGAACSKPDALFARASYAFHTYYAKFESQQGPGACNFGGSATLVSTLPSNLWDGPCTALTPVKGHFCVAKC